MTTQEKLLDAAESSIRERGYHAVSFRELASEVGIKSSSVHHYYRYKEDLVIAVLNRYGDRYFSELEKDTERLRSSKSKLRVFFDSYRKSFLQHEKYCMVGMLGAESQGVPNLVCHAVTTFFDREVEWVEGLFPSDMAAAERSRHANLIVSALQGAMMMSTCQQDIQVLDKVIRSLTESYDDQL